MSANRFFSISAARALEISTLESPKILIFSQAAALTHVTLVTILTLPSTWMCTRRSKSMMRCAQRTAHANSLALSKSPGPLWISKQLAAVANGIGPAAKSWLTLLALKILHQQRPTNSSNLLRLLRRTQHGQLLMTWLNSSRRHTIALESANKPCSTTPGRSKLRASRIKPALEVLKMTWITSSWVSERWHSYPASFFSLSSSSSTASGVNTIEQANLLHM